MKRPRSADTDFLPPDARKSPQHPPHLQNPPIPPVDAAWITKMRGVGLDTLCRLPRVGDVAALFGLGGAPKVCAEQLVVGRGGVMSCECSVCGAWKSYVGGRAFGRRVYEVLTQDLIDALAEHIAGGVPQEDKGTKTVVLEVGGGNGALSHHLKKALGLLGGAGGGFEMVCTDSGARGLHAERSDGEEEGFDVATMAHEEALQRYRPHVVLCCWMELGEDWTAAFRACDSVREYILVGEADTGICGHPRSTWGAGGRAGRRPRYEREGFERRRVREGCLQICKTDDPWCGASRSSVVSFRRVLPAPTGGGGGAPGAEGGGGAGSSSSSSSSSSPSSPSESPPADG